MGYLIRCENSGPSRQRRTQFFAARGREMPVRAITLRRIRFLSIPLFGFAQLVLAIVVGGGDAAAQVYDEARFAQVRAKLDTQYASLAGRGYKREALEVIIPMGPLHAMSFQLELIAGRTYAFVAACDDVCKQVDLVVTNMNREAVTHRTDDGNVAILGGSVAIGGVHFGALQAPGCPDDRCQAGLSVLYLEGPAVVPGVQKR